MITNCGHPEWPVFALPANDVISLEKIQETNHPLIESAKVPPVVRVGDLVRLWKQESLLRIEVAGVSEESGSVGKTIRVRLLHNNTDGQSAPEEFSGVVRGPSDVEIQP
jgi:flagella basal body P-ring formation protein FlgA